MSIESFSPLPLTVFGTWVTLLNPSDVPAGISPSLGDVEFFPGGVRTRPGLASQFSARAGTPQVSRTSCCGCWYSRATAAPRSTKRPRR